MAIVNSLFADYLGFADRRDPTLTNTSTASPISKPTVQTTAAPARVLPNEAGGYMPQPPMLGSIIKPTVQATTAPARVLPDETAGKIQQPTEEIANLDMDLSGFEGLDLSGLEGLDLFGGTPLNLGPFGTESVMSMTKYLEGLPQNAAEYFERSQDYLSGVNTDKFSGVHINQRDDLYNDYFGVGSSGLPAYRYQGDPADFRAEAGLSDNFAVYDNPNSQITTESVQNAYNLLASSQDPTATLSEYYGFDVTPTENKDADYSRAAKYGTTSEKMAEFQSIVEPILQKSIPYIAATQGLNYTDALEYAYTHDPMVAALYNQYGVDLYRQTKDGSTYIYDPIAGQEIRTLEVKDANPLPIIAGLALSFTGVPVALGGMFGATGATASAIGQGLVSASTAAIGGARGSDLLKAGVLGAAGGYVKGLQNTVTELGAAADAANAAGDVATAADLTSQAATASSQLDLVDTIYNTTRAIDAIANEDYVGAALIGLDEAGFSLNDWTTEKLNSTFGVDGEILGMNTNDLAVGVNSFGIKLLEGEDPEDALKSAVVDYAKAGGSFPDLGIDIALPDIDSSGFLDVVLNSNVVDTIRQLGRDFDDTVIQPVVGTIEETGKLIDDQIIQPTRETLKDIDIPKPDIDVPEIKLPSLPDVDLPEVDLPDVDLPSFDLPSVDVGMGSGGMLGGLSTAGKLAQKYTGKGLSFNPQLLTSAIPQGPQQDYLAQLLAGLRA